MQLMYTFFRVLSQNVNPTIILIAGLITECERAVTGSINSTIPIAFLANEIQVRHSRKN